MRKLIFSLSAAVLLSSSAIAWAAPKASSKDLPPNAEELMLEAQRLSNEALWEQATVKARAAMKAAHASEDLDGPEFEAGYLLVVLLQIQGKYVEALDAAEEQIARWDAKSASAGQTGSRDPRSMKMLSLAIEASMMAGDRAKVMRLQEKLYAVANPYPESWRLAPEEPRLRYELADFEMPLMLGQWKLMAFEPVDSRGVGMRVLYTHVSAGSNLSADISLSYKEKLRAMNVAQRKEFLESYREVPIATEMVRAMPDLPFADATSIKVEKAEGCKGEHCVAVHWKALNGDWMMDINVNLQSPEKEQAAEQVRQLFAALKWNSAPLLFRERTMAEQNREMDSYWAAPGGKSKAAELAEKALPDAFFPEEIARLNTYIGVAQYRRGDLIAARRSLELALLARDHISILGAYIETTLDYAADIAYRQGRDAEAIALNRTLMEWQEDNAGLGWGITDNENALISWLDDVQLPWRVGNHRLRVTGAGRFSYENLSTRARLGLTVGLDPSTDVEMESVMRAFMEKKLRLRAGDVRKTAFSPKSAKKGKQRGIGRKWEFDVTKLDDEKVAADKAPVTDSLLPTPTKMTFWIVDRKDRRSILRAPIVHGDQSEIEADQIARALSW
ncbi:hypothetical protein ACM1ZW_20585 [Pseudomonas sp. NFX71]|uniref:hypothetical protein n=1 Tax=Pseudomonas sp. NFX71 TaxID=3399121 RepID=UPI003A87E7B6